VCVCASDLSNNRLQRIKGLTFQGLSSVVSLRLRRNLLTQLMDGAFYGLTNIESMYVTWLSGQHCVCQYVDTLAETVCVCLCMCLCMSVHVCVYFSRLDYNNLSRVHGGFLFGLETLQHLWVAIVHLSLCPLICLSACLFVCVSAEYRDSCWVAVVKGLLLLVLVCSTLCFCLSVCVSVCVEHLKFIRVYLAGSLWHRWLVMWCELLVVVCLFVCRSLSSNHISVIDADSWTACTRLTYL